MAFALSNWLKSKIALIPRRARTSMASDIPGRNLLRRCSMRVQTRLLLCLLIAALTSMFLWLKASHCNYASAHVHIASDLVMHSQRIGKVVPNAIQGNPTAFGQLSESRQQFSRGINLLRHGGSDQGAVIHQSEPDEKIELYQVQRLWERTDKATGTILQLQNELTTFGVTLTRLCQLSQPMLDASERVAALQSLRGSVMQKEATAQLVMLTLRLGRSVSELLAVDGVNSESARSLGKDVAMFRRTLETYLKSIDKRTMSGVEYKQISEKLRELERLFDDYEPLVASILVNLQNFMLANQAGQLVSGENEALKEHLSILQNDYRRIKDTRHWYFWMILASMAGALLSAVGIARLQLENSRRSAAAADSRRQEAEAQRLHAQQQEVLAIRANAANQEAILCLMNELQKVADGDLTVQTTVSNDLTGAIAASVNYTVEALRGLVGQVTHTAEQVAAASNQVKEDAQDLSRSGQLQARRIQDTGQSMLKMSVHSTDVSISANKSADVARHSVVVAERGARAVEDAVKGMAEIREQIQETSKRIKRLGVSSQEIGEITELISDITEQTNVLALNAAIQAASAGEAGRGFSVVAEEVQRLAERSSAATRQIGALVRMIQDDTHDAAAAMEKSTAGVVEGARLSDAAGASLADIRRVSNQLAELIQHISSSAGHQATLANSVAQDIQNILNESEVIEGRREQALSLFGELSELAELLKSSVSRFRVMISDTKSSASKP